MGTNLELAESRFQALHDDLSRLKRALNGVIVGQEKLIDDLLIAVFAGGHVLLEGLPGLGKTHLVKALAAGMGLPPARIQCTPDLMPADITGSEILARDDGGQQRLEFRPGPIFAPVLLVDEINRATPKAQAALLEAMQEYQVTYAGKRYPLSRPFWVIATQNPIELEGTYPLPEAQLDRFMVKIAVEYPSRGALRSMLGVSLDDEPADHLDPVLSRGRVDAILAQAREAVIASALKEAAVKLVLATHPDDQHAHALARQHIRYGASPRGLQALLRAARVAALLDGRPQVAFDDLHRVALPVLRHRVLLRMESELDGVEIDAVLAQLVRECVPER
jgi:MoxR-like ATPase